MEPKGAKDFLIDWWESVVKEAEPAEPDPDLLRKKIATAFAAFGGVDTTSGGN